jgi:hypothetical protein
MKDNKTIAHSKNKDVLLFNLLSNLCFKLHSLT